MVRTMVYLPDELHRAIKHLAVERGTSLAKLVAEAVEVLCREDANDLKIGHERLASFLANPTKAIPYSIYLSKRPKR